MTKSMPFMHMRRRQQPRLDDVDVAGVEGEEAKRAERQKLKRAYLKVAVNFPCGQDGFQGLQYISRCKCLVFGWCARAWESWIGNEGGERELTHPFGGFLFFSTWVKTHSVL